MTRSTWGTPAKAGGWPTFDKAGKIVRPEPEPEVYVQPTLWGVDGV